MRTRRKRLSVIRNALVLLLVSALNAEAGPSYIAACYTSGSNFRSAFEKFGARDTGPANMYLSSAWSTRARCMAEVEPYGWERKNACENMYREYKNAIDALLAGQNNPSDFSNLNAADSLTKGGIEAATCAGQ